MTEAMQITVSSEMANRMDDSSSTLRAEPVSPTGRERLGWFQTWR